MRQQALANTVMPYVQKINNTIAKLQQLVQHVNIHVAPAQGALFQAYPDVATLFNHLRPLPLDGLRKELVLDHNADYVDEQEYSLHCYVVLTLSLAYFIGGEEDPLVRIGKPVGTSDADWIWHFHEHLLSSADKLFELIKADSGSEAAISVLMLYVSDGVLGDLVQGGNGDTSQKLLLSKDAFVKDLSDHSKRNSFIKNLKERFHKPLKIGNPYALSLGTLCPYVRVYSCRQLSLDTKLWSSWVFGNHVPILRFLDYMQVAATKDGPTSGTSMFEIKVNGDQVRTSVELSLRPGARFFRSEPEERLKDAFNKLPIAIRHEIAYISGQRIGEETTGFAVGDTVLPFKQLVRSLPSVVFEADRKCLLPQVTQKQIGAETGLEIELFDPFMFLDEKNQPSGAAITISVTKSSVIIMSLCVPPRTRSTGGVRIGLGDHEG